MLSQAIMLTISKLYDAAVLFWAEIRQLLNFLGG